MSSRFSKVALMLSIITLAIVCFQTFKEYLNINLVLNYLQIIILLIVALIFQKMRLVSDKTKQELYKALDEVYSLKLDKHYLQKNLDKYLKDKNKK